MPATLQRHQRQHNGQLEFVVQGNTGRPSLPLSPSARSYLRDSVRLLTVPNPQTPLNTEVHVNIHTGHAVWQWHNHSLLLDPEGFGQNFPHLGKSFVHFVVANLPPDSRKLLPNNPVGRNSTTIQTFNAPQFKKLPTEVLQNIGSKSTAATLKALSLTNRANANVFQYNLDAVHSMVHAGKTVVTAPDGQPLLGDDGEPMREYPAVLGQDHMPIVDSNGHTVRRPAETSDAYFHTRKAARLPLVNADGGRILDAQKQVVRAPSPFNAAFYEDALMHIETGVKPAYQQAALNNLTETIRQNPVPDYMPAIDIETETVTFPALLVASLQSQSKYVRDWALERVEESFNKILMNHPRQRPKFICDAIKEHLRNVPGYQPTVNVTQQKNRQITHVRYGDLHKSMFYSPNPCVRHFCESFSNSIHEIHHPRAARTMLDRQNGIHSFPTRRGSNGQISEVPISGAYNSWLAARPTEALGVNLQRLIDLMTAAHPNLSGAITRGVAKYLVRNVAHWHPQRLERLLFSDAVLYYAGNLLSRHREIFFAELSQPNIRGHQIPVHIVAEVGIRMGIIYRNEWTQQRYNQTQGNISGAGSGEDFANWASKRRVDLPTFAFASSQELHKFVTDYAGNNQVRQTEAQGMLNWLRQGQNATNAPR